MDFPAELLKRIPKEKQDALKELLSEDPRPHYITDDERIYGFEFADFEIKFKVEGNLLTVTEVVNQDLR